jgi:disulfide oxidoreductase YuzD
MNLLKRIFTTAAIACAACLFINSSVNAHDFLKNPVKERYGLKSASCYVCHPGSNKAINNAFGLKFKEAFKGKDYTKQVHDAKTLKKKDKEAGEKALDAIEVAMVADFNAAVVEIEKTKMSFAEMAKAGMLMGTKLEKATIAEMGKAQGVEDK